MNRARPSLPVWVRTCFCRSPEVLKALLHSSSGHLYGFSPVWVRTWLFSPYPVRGWEGGIGRMLREPQPPWPHYPNSEALHLQVGSVWLHSSSSNRSLCRPLSLPNPGQIRGAGKAHAALLPSSGQPVPFWNVHLRATARGFQGEMKSGETHGPNTPQPMEEGGGSLYQAPLIPLPAWIMLPPITGFLPDGPCKSERLDSSCSRKAGNSQSESRTFHPRMEAVHF